MMILLAIIYLVLLFTVTEVTLFISIFVVACYFWQITLSLIAIILLFMFLKWLATELIDGIIDFGNMRKDFGWDNKKKKHPDDDIIMHIDKEKMKEFDEWFNGKKDDDSIIKP